MVIEDHVVDLLKSLQAKSFYRDTASAVLELIKTLKQKSFHEKPDVDDAKVVITWDQEDSCYNFFKLMSFMQPFSYYDEIAIDFVNVKELSGRLRKEIASLKEKSVPLKNQIEEFEQKIERGEENENVESLREVINSLVSEGEQDALKRLEAHIQSNIAQIQESHDLPSLKSHFDYETSSYFDKSRWEFYPPRDLAFLLMLNLLEHFGSNLSLAFYKYSLLKGVTPDLNIDLKRSLVYYKGFDTTLRSESDFISEVESLVTTAKTSPFGTNTLKELFDELPSKWFDEEQIRFGRSIKRLAIFLAYYIHEFMDGYFIDSLLSQREDINLCLEKMMMSGDWIDSILALSIHITHEPEEAQQKLEELGASDSPLGTPYELLHCLTSNLSTSLLPSHYGSLEDLKEAHDNQLKDLLSKVSSYEQWIEHSERSPLKSYMMIHNMVGYSPIIISTKKSCNVSRSFRIKILLSLLKSFVNVNKGSKKRLELVFTPEKTTVKKHSFTLTETEKTLWNHPSDELPIAPQIFLMEGVDLSFECSKKSLEFVHRELDEHSRIELHSGVSEHFYRPKKIERTHKVTISVDRDENLLFETADHPLSTITIPRDSFSKFTIKDQGKDLKELLTFTSHNFVTMLVKLFPLWISTDDLRILEGVAEVTANRLREAGFTSLKDIASSTVKALKKVEKIGKVKAEKMIESARDLLERGSDSFEFGLKESTFLSVIAEFKDLSMKVRVMIPHYHRVDFDDEDEDEW